MTIHWEVRPARDKVRGGAVLTFLAFQCPRVACTPYENVSKNRNGSFKQLHINSKVVPVFPCHEAGQRCPVYFLDSYISKLPEEAKQNGLL